MVYTLSHKIASILQKIYLTILIIARCRSYPPLNRPDWHNHSSAVEGGEVLLGAHDRAQSTGDAGFVQHFE
jgi:hypothetical protein